jgi:hypothetical protein
VKRSAARFPLSARTGGSCHRTRVTIAFAICAAMRNLVPGRVVPQPAAQVRAKPLGPDLGSDLGTGAVKGSDLGTGAVKGSDLGAGAVKGRADDSMLLPAQRCSSRFPAVNETPDARKSGPSVGSLLHPGTCGHGSIPDRRSAYHLSTDTLGCALLIRSFGTRASTARMLVHDPVQERLDLGGRRQVVNPL